MIEANPSDIHGDKETSGEEFCRLVRERWPSIGIVFATGSNQGQNYRTGHGRPFLSSRIHFEELQGAIKAVSE